MQFVDSLPTEAVNVWWQVVTPIDDVKRSIEAVRSGDELYVDLAINRDGKYQALIRILPDLLLGVNRNQDSENVLRIERAKAFFLDLDGVMTENLVGLRLVISTSDTEHSVRYVVMWPEDIGHIAYAS